MLTAKAMVTAAYGALITLAGTASAVAVGAVSLRVEGLPAGSFGADMWAVAAGSVAIGALWALLAAGLGMLARNGTVAVATVLLWWLVLEGLLPAVTGNPEITRWLPGGAANALLLRRADLFGTRPERQPRVADPQRRWNRRLPPDLQRPGRCGARVRRWRPAHGDRRHRWAVRVLRLLLDGSPVADLRFCDEALNDSGQLAIQVTFDDPTVPEGRRIAIYRATLAS
ncbi:MAG: hypothetical protein ACRDVN_13940 [Jiangellaceae bacterium]